MTKLVSYSYWAVPTSKRKASDRCSHMTAYLRDDGSVLFTGGNFGPHTIKDRTPSEVNAHWIGYVHATAGPRSVPARIPARMLTPTIAKP